jgi:SAM-dependent methyltransferase
MSVMPTDAQKQTTLNYPQTFYDYQKAGSLASAEVVVPLLNAMLHPSSVVDVGCGVGTWLSAFSRDGIPDVYGVDGDHVPRGDLMIPVERFAPVDLCKPFTLPRAFDLAISLEVAEHLPSSAADTFVASLTRLARAVIFSAAVPHQGGWNHVNEQWPQYWAEKFGRQRFFPVDCLREPLWDDTRVCWWYAQNMILYLTEDHPLWRSYARLPARVRALVHPRNYLLRVADAASATRPRSPLRRLVGRIAARFRERNQ